MNNIADTCDLVIVGAGLAGLTAGVRAAELGLRPVVLEKGDGKQYPCNSRMSGGILHIGFHDPFRPPGELKELIDRLTDGEASPTLATALSVTGARLIDWLQSHGARFMRFNPQEAYRWCMSPPRALRAGNDWMDRGPDQILRKLADDLVALGGTLQLRAQATQLLLRDGACVGVSGIADGVPCEWRAPHVLLADGGFQSNRTLYETHIGADFDSVFQRGARTGTGSGLEMATEAGAALAGTNRFYGHVLCADARTNENVWPYPEIDAIATAGIVVDQTGRRVVDEGVNGVFLANALATLPGKHTFYAVFDAAIWEGPGTSARIPANPLLEKAGGTVLRADSPEALARQMGVDPVALTRAIREYDDAVRQTSNQQDALASLPVPRSAKIKPLRIAQTPFMAIPVCPGITYTMGGIAINEHAEVLGADGAPIAGLLAAGATTGGLEGGRNVAYIGGLMKAGSFGLIAAERAAALQGKPPEARNASGSATPDPRPKPDTPYASGAGQPTEQAPGAPQKHGIARFPVLSATLRYGKPVALLLAAIVGALTWWLAAPALGGLAFVLAIVLGGVTAGIALGYVELIRLIVEFLMPE